MTIKNQKNIRFLFVILSIIVLVGIDRITKILVEKYIADNPIEIINGVLRLEMLPGGNKGAAWGMLSGHQILFVVIAFVVCLGLLFVIYNMPFQRKYLSLIILMTLIICGGVGNMIDRLLFGTVTDFINCYIINFPYFNVADMYVSVATVVFVLLFLFYYKNEDLEEIEKSIKDVLIKKKNN